VSALLALIVCMFLGRVLLPAVVGIREVLSVYTQLLSVLAQVLSVLSTVLSVLRALLTV
jgi:hypothetical protein